MRIKAIDVTDALPVRRFVVDNLADVVVLAGPNGVGKTRLVQAIMNGVQSGAANANTRLLIESTSDEEQAAWGQDTIDTSLAPDVARLRTTLHRNRRRSDLRSTVFQIESDRSIGNINPYAFSFDAIDPFDEMINWNFGFTRLRDRFQDTQNAIFRKVHARRLEIASQAEAAMSRGESVLPLAFPDPLKPFKEAFSQLLAPKQLLDADPRDQQLYYNLDSQRFPVSSLSSGEREVVNVVFDFIMRSPADSIIVFDEPELHLHPELSYRLLQTLRTVGERNQFIFVTHSAEIITASLDQSVVFVAPPRVDGGNQAIPVREDDTTNQALRLLGQSIGIVSLGKRLVLIEGTSGSLDKQTYGAILKDKFPGLVLVPSGGKGLIRSFSVLVEQVLERTIWGVEFFMLCDRDAIPPHLDTEALITRAGGRLRVLGRYHLENYFLDEHTLARAFADMEASDSWLRDPDQIKAKLKEIARTMIPYATALIVATKRREAFGNVDLMPRGSHDKSVEELADLFRRQVEEETQRFQGVVASESIADDVRSVFAELQASIDAPDDAWRRLIPGKQLFDRFSSTAAIGSGRLKQLYIKSAEDMSPSPFDEILRIFEEFSIDFPVNG